MYYEDLAEIDSVYRKNGLNANLAVRSIKQEAKIILDQSVIENVVDDVNEDVIDVGITDTMFFVHTEGARELFAFGTLGS